MNEDTTKLIEQLAAKLGTTTEYLWGVLLKQAFISATTDLIFFIIACLSGYLLYKLHIKFSNKENKISYYNYEEALVLPIAFLAIIWIIFFMIMLFSWGNIINGYFNPEYWALRQILNLL